MAAVFSPAVDRLVELGFLYRTLRTATGLPRGSGRLAVSRSERLLSSSAVFLGGVTSLLNTLFARVDKLRAAAQVLVSSNGNGVFSQKAGFSSDPDLVDVTVGNGAADDKFHISVAEIAETQQNIGKQLTGSNISEFIPVRNFFTITSESSVNTVFFEVEKAGGNRTALLEIAQQINVADIGVNAEVVNDDDEFRIILTSGASGNGGGFTVADLTGNTVSVSEMDTVVLAAQDADFAIDGTQLTSSENSFTLAGSSVRVEILQSTRQLVGIEIRSNADVVTASLDAFFIAFNDVLAFLSNGTFSQAVRAKDALSSRIREVRGELSLIGIEQDRTGRLEVDETVFKRALRDDPKTVEALIGGVEGIATKLAGELEQIASGPVARL